MIHIDVLKLPSVTFAVIIDSNDVILLDVLFLVVVLVVADYGVIIWNNSVKYVDRSSFARRL